MEIFRDAGLDFEIHRAEGIAVMLEMGDLQFAFLEQVAELAHDGHGAAGERVGQGVHG